MKHLFYLIFLLLISTSPVLAQTITTVAGTGTMGDSPDGTPATSASIGQVHSIAVDRQGFLYIATLFSPTLNKVQQISAAGTLITVAGGGTLTAEGAPAASAMLQFPYGLDIDAQGQLYIAENIGGRVKLVTSAGSITTIAGGGGSTADGVPAITASLANLHGVAIKPSGGFFTIQQGPNVIRFVTPAGSITTVAGTGTAGFSGDNGPAINALINGAHDVVADLQGNFYIAEQNNNRIRKVNTAGIITTVAGSSLGAGFSGDNGPATDARLNTPSGLALDGAGNLYIADRYNHRIRKVDLTTGIITSVAGNGETGFSGDGGLPLEAKLGNPYDVAIDRQGILYVSQLNTYIVRKIVGVAESFLPAISLGTPAAVCSSSPSFTIPFAGTTKNPTSYTVTGTGLAPGQTGPLSGTSGSITVAITPAFTGSYTIQVSNSTDTSLPLSGSVTVLPLASTPVVSNITSTGALGNGICSVRINGTASGNSFVVRGPGGYVYSNVYRTTGTYPFFASDIRQPGIYTLSATSLDACGSTVTVTRQITVEGTACN